MDAINQLPIASVYMYIHKVIEYGSAQKRDGYACEENSRRERRERRASVVARSVHEYLLFWKGTQINTNCHEYLRGGGCGGEMSEEMDAINQLPIASVYMYIHKVIEYGSAQKRDGYACEENSRRERRERRASVVARSVHEYLLFWKGTQINTNCHEYLRDGLCCGVCDGYKCEVLRMPIAIWDCL